MIPILEQWIQNLDPWTPPPAMPADLPHRVVMRLKQDLRIPAAFLLTVLVASLACGGGKSEQHMTEIARGPIASELIALRAKPIDLDATIQSDGRVVLAWVVVAKPANPLSSSGDAELQASIIDPAASDEGVPPILQTKDVTPVRAFGLRDGSHVIFGPNLHHMRLRATGTGWEDLGDLAPSLDALGGLFDIATVGDSAVRIVYLRVGFLGGTRTGTSLCTTVWPRPGDARDSISEISQLPAGQYSMPPPRLVVLQDGSSFVFAVQIVPGRRTQVTPSRVDIEPPTAELRVFSRAGDRSPWRAHQNIPVRDPLTGEPTDLQAFDVLPWTHNWYVVLATPALLAGGLDVESGTLKVEQVSELDVAATTTAGARPVRLVSRGGHLFGVWIAKDHPSTARSGSALHRGERASDRIWLAEFEDSILPGQDRNIQPVRLVTEGKTAGAFTIVTSNQQAYCIFAEGDRAGSATSIKQAALVPAGR